MNKPTILVDFDGVIHSYTSGWKGIDQIPDEPVEGALEWLRELVDTDKFIVCIYSSRSKEAAGRIAMAEWIAHWQGIKELPLTEYWMPETKPAAFLTLDDRCIQFRGPGTFPQLEEILAFKPWNLRKATMATETQEQPWAVEQKVMYVVTYGARGATVGDYVRTGCLPQSPSGIEKGIAQGREWALAWWASLLC